MNRVSIIDDKLIKKLYCQSTERDGGLRDIENRTVCAYMNRTRTKEFIRLRKLIIPESIKLFNVLEISKEVL